MEQLARLQARIASLHELRDLFRALRALAASHVQEAQGTLAGIRSYAGVVEDAIGEAATLLSRAGDDPTFALPSGPGALIVVCSEHGFVGAFNDQLLDRAAAEKTVDEKLVVVGRRGAMLAEERGYAVDRNFAMATHVGGVLAVARRLADYLAATPSARIVFGRHRKLGDFEAETRTVLPLDLALLARQGRRSPPLHHLAPDDLLRRLADEYLFGEITRALMESLASENAARLHVMEAADHNIGDKLEGLGRSERAVRQESITSELLDLVIGSEAILSPDAGR